MRGQVSDASSAVTEVPDALQQLLRHPPDMAKIRMPAAAVHIIAEWVPAELVAEPPKRIYLFDVDGEHVDLFTSAAGGARGLFGVSVAAAVRALEIPSPPSSTVRASLS